MGKRSVARHLDFIKKISRSGKPVRDRYLKAATPEQIRSLLECTLNVCNGNIPLNTRQLSKLKRHKKNLKVVFSKSNLQNKRKFLIQKGGFLPLIASAALSILGPLISKLV